LYNYFGPATRVVDVFAKETWKYLPYVYEDEKVSSLTFENAVAELFKDNRIQLVKRMMEADCLSGIGRYGGLILGFNDGKKLSEPVTDFDELTGQIIPSSKPLKLIYVKPFDEFTCSISRTQMDPGSYRYGAPLMYKWKQFDSTTYDRQFFSDETTVFNYVDVHWTRIIHISDTAKDSQWLANPRMQNIIPFLYDIRKISGGSAEGYWKSAFPGISIEALPELFSNGMFPEFDEDSIRRDLDKMSNGFQRYITLQGATAKSLAPNTVDPTPFLNVPLQLMCASIDVPLKTFLGSQTGKESSQADERKWDDNCGTRRMLHADPVIVRQLLDRLVTYKCLPAPTGSSQYLIDWINPFAKVSKEQSDVTLKRAQAVAQYAGSNAPSVMGPIHFMTGVMNMSMDQAKEALAEAEKTKKKILPPNPIPQKPGGVKKGNAQKASSGRPTKGSKS